MTTISNGCHFLIVYMKTTCYAGGSKKLPAVSRKEKTPLLE
jgi:hypothetical protein